MRRHAVDTLAVSAAALLATIVMAAPVVRAPSERIFGAEIVGRHHDPFTVMQQFARPMSVGLYSQPVTDLTGAAIARGTGAVAAYNWLVLLSFPLSAAAAYLLARHFELPRAGALFAALLFAFSPFHIAHAAYHPHIAQTQWLPLYLLALWRCMDRADLRASAFLGAATIAVTLSNFYGGLIAAVVTPAAVAVYWFARARFGTDAPRRLAVTIGTLTGLALAGLAFVGWHAGAVLSHRAAFAFTRGDLFLYSAKWWSYLVPPVVHPLLGGLARRIWIAAGVNDGLLEQQVSLGWSVIALGLIAIGGWLATAVAPPRSAGLPGPRSSALKGPPYNNSVPILAGVAIVALVCSLSPERTVFGVTISRPSALLYSIVPMFRSYARFGVVVQLMAALLAGVGASRLLARGTRSARVLCAGLVMLAIAEYAVSPLALSRDVLPTEAHRWVMQQTAGSRVLDCEPLTPASASIAWLTHDRIEALDSRFDGCAEPQMAARLWAAGFTHLLVRDTWERQWLNEHGDANGFERQARFADADVFLLKPRELLYTDQVTGFWPREHGDHATWRWMGADASWTIVTPTPQSRVMLDVDMRAFHVTRPLAVRLDGGREQVLNVDPGARTYAIGPLALTAGPHVLTFHSAAPATRADEVIGNGDRRALSFAMGAWKWSEQ
ncbi:MAG TPA: 6-pyruvoyl-tetrahydropterin synthase-related protein [Vicinamibacterales bacterium]|nr:6-pyruvoyl-tetrahydropterin synthase-related protein [Vicinamibacterales bacterium]